MSTTEPRDLVTWLTAQLDADEATALRATPGPWVSESSGPTGPVVMDAESRNARDHVARCPHYLAAFDAEHIARHDPARVLADVAAKRAIVALHWQWRDDEGPSDICDACDGMRYPCLTLQHLAYAYHLAGAPGWREEWTP